MFKNLNISTRIYTTQYIVLGLMALVGTLGIMSLGTLNERVNTVIQGEAAEIRLGARMLQDLLFVSRAEKNLLIAETQEEMDFHEKAMTETRNLMQERLKELAPLVTGRDSSYSLQRFNEIFAEYTTVSDQVVALSRQNTNKRAAELSQGEAQVAFNKAYQNLDNIININVEKEKVLGTRVKQFLKEKNIEASPELARERNRMLKIFLRTSGFTALGIDIELDLTELQRVEKTVVISDDQDEMDEFIANLEKNRSELKSKIAALGRFFEEEKEEEEEVRLEFHSFQKNVQNYIKLHEEVLATARLNTDARAQRLSNSKSLELQDAAEQQLRNIVDAAEARLDATSISTDDDYQNSFISMLTVLAFAVIFGLAMSILLVKTLGARIRFIVEMADNIASGNVLVQQQQQQQQQDELSRLIEAMNNITDAFAQVVEVTQDMAVGNYDRRIEERSAEDPLADAINQMATNLVEITRQADTIAQGDFTANIAARSEQDQLGLAMQNMTRTLRDASEVAEAVADGNLDVRVESKGANDLLATSVNRMIDSLAEIVRQVDVIAQGDYTADISPRSEKDRLGIAMQSMTLTLRQASEVVELVANGDLNRRVEQKGANDLLANSINLMIDSLGNIVEQVDIISMGDYTAEIQPRSAHDTLGIAMQRMTQSLREIGEVTALVAVGDYSRQVNAKGENDLLAATINQMVGNLGDIVSQANTIAGGDYTAEIAARSDKDELGIAMRKMTENLRTTDAENTKNSWLQNGLASLNNSLRGEQRIEDLANSVIEGLCVYLEAQVGGLYILVETDKDGEALADADKELQLLGSYAYTQRKNISNTFKVGESLVGQAALEKHQIQISNVPDDYVKVVSGLGESTPHHVLVSPFLYENSVRGVIEIATVAPLQENAAEMLERGMEAIGIAFEGARRSAELDKSLKEAQTLAEEMQSQQEELQETNEQLEEQTQALEKAQKDTEQRNEQLEVAQEELNERAEQLAQSSKYKSEFLANMSHELRTPLNSIMLLSKMMAAGESGDMSEKQREHADVIHGAGRDLLGLINEVLDLSKIEAGKMPIHLEDIKLADVKNKLKGLFETMAEQKKLPFEISIDPALPERIRTDGARLEQVLRNFLSNAFKFTKQGGITLLIAPVSDEHIKHITSFGTLKDELRKNSANYMSFSVTDTGLGIPKDKTNLIFEAFQQADGGTSREYGGTGLGLSISREIAGVLEGAISLESTAGKGSTFTLILPRKPGEAMESIFGKEDGLMGNMPATSSGNSSLTVGSLPDGNLKDDTFAINSKDERILLVVEDDPRFAQTLLDLGREHDFKVLHAATGTEGVRLAEHYIPAAIILDIQLPIMDGWSVLRHLKNTPKTRHIPVHVMSVMEDVHFGYRLGAAQYFVKPIEPEAIDKAFLKIEEHLQKEIRQLLVVEDEETDRNAIIELIGDRDVECTGAATGKEAMTAIRSGKFDAMVLDLRLPDVDGFEVLKQVAADPEIKHLPTIVYTGKDLSLEDEQQLREYAESIILKTADSPGRLLQETTIFLHRVQANMADEKTKILEEIDHLEDSFIDKTILAVDDDIRNIYALNGVLTNRGLKMLSARNGIEALEMLEKHPEIELVLMDIMMPEMDGYETTRKIREQEKWQNLPVIALTAKAQKEDKDKCMAAGASDYMSKPIDHDQLVSLVRVWLRVKKG